MNRERIGKAKHKAPKFKDYDDASLMWEEKLEMKKLRKKKKQRRPSFELDY